MDIAPFGVEDWLNVHEKSATYDIAQSTIASMTLDELVALGAPRGLVADAAEAAFPQDARRAPPRWASSRAWVPRR